MERYGGDYHRRPMRYGGEYQQWGGMPRYDRQFGQPGDRSGRFYERDFSGYEQGGYGYRGGPRYDRGFVDRGPDRGGGDRQWYGRDFAHDPSYQHAMRDMRHYPSPWSDNFPGRSFGYALGYGMGRGQYIYK